MRILLAALLLSPALALAQPTPRPTESFKLDIPATSAREAMQALADQTGVQVAYGSQDLFGVRTNPVKGEMSYESALDRMLAGTGLDYRSDDFSGRVVILRRDAVLPRPDPPQAREPR